MHYRVKHCVNWCMKSEVIALTSFVMYARTDAQHFYVPQWLRHGGGQKYRRGSELHVQKQSSDVIDIAHPWRLESAELLICHLEILGDNISRLLLLNHDTKLCT